MAPVQHTTLEVTVQPIGPGQYATDIVLAAKDDIRIIRVQANVKSDIPVSNSLPSKPRVKR